MAQAKNGDKVRIDYTGMLEDGTVFDSTRESEDCESEDCESENCESEDCGCGCGNEHGSEHGPRELVIGKGEFLPAIEEALIGMSTGEKKKVIIPADDAFGEYDEERVFSIPRSDLPEDMKPEVGDEIVLVNENDEELAVLVVEVSDEEINFDANHPLAGEDVTFEIELVEIL
ncbi:MAG: FKBP-type peptidyl-prolyl cis-trans isomerase [Geobacteraceae bacterium]|nr:FKBP-type peptidyl-prolyl cis-trans isomerase [Geobacteraceae bacterium]